MLLDRVIQQISIPVILTTVDGEPQAHKIARIPDNTLPFPEETLRQLRQITITMDKENPPIPIEYNGTVLNLIHYGDSEMIRLLNWLPAIALAHCRPVHISRFAGFNNIRKSEERFTWVGMAKETAHQLGTPISSLIGWIEMLKESQIPERTAEIIKEMGSDATRLTKVAQRFRRSVQIPKWRTRILSRFSAMSLIIFGKGCLNRGNQLSYMKTFRKRPSRRSIRTCSNGRLKI